ncbi:MAG: hypothetical protein DMG81_05430 [Acidobacteria bacterium]|nr:MAG: hypothetical protein DMG81_05430 [Acidobacteriota bacterium]
MIRLGLIGCGEHSEGGHAIPLAKYKAAHPEEIELAAVCDLKLDRAERFCRKYGFRKACGDVDGMLAEKLDACISVVPVGQISEVGIKLLRASIPCVVEKPLGSSMEEVKALLRAARATRTPNFVSVNRRFMPFLNQAIEWAREAGSLRYVRCTFTRHARREPEFLWGTAVHGMDTLRHIAGDVAKAEIRTLKSGDGLTGWYAIDLRFASGVCGRLDVLPTAGVLEETYELIGEGFRAVVTCPFGPERGWRAYRENRLVIEERASETLPEEVMNGCYDETAEFVRALINHVRPRPSIEDVFPSVELCWHLAEKIRQKTGELVL